MDMIKHSPYHHKFVAHGATREAVGVFDVYYQIAVEVAGRNAEPFLQGAVVADADGLRLRA